VGLIKVALSIAHREVPPSLNFQSPHPNIPLDELHLRVQRDLQPWPSPNRPLIAGVSSFGMGGTNCHAVLADCPSAPRLAGEPAPSSALATRSQLALVSEGLVPWVVSARGEAALRELAGRLAASPAVGGDAAGWGGRWRGGRRCRIGRWWSGTALCV
jgi:acyl transferase domain-containing protein